jgi:hypothetical protein
MRTDIGRGKCIVLAKAPDDDGRMSREQEV